MRIDKVNYQKLFPIGSYLNERIGFEASVDEGENIFQVLEELKKIADMSHKTINPDNIVYSEPTENSSHKENSEPENVPKSKEAQVTAIVRQIGTCREKKVLETYRFIAQSNPDIQTAYNKKMEEFV